MVDGPMLLGEIHLARDGTDALWLVLGSWTPSIYRWFCMKYLICMKHPEVSKLWYTAHSKLGYDEIMYAAYRGLQDGDRETYLGFSEL